jgi:hypothetical protein
MGEAPPSSCGLIACEQAWKMYRDKIPCRMMSLVLGPDHPGNGTRHFLLIYRMPTGEFFAYSGECGSRCLGKINAHVIDIARAYDPSGTGARWITAMGEEFEKEQRAMES